MIMADIDAKSDYRQDETNGYKATIRNWAENCDFHGIPNLERSKHPLRKLFWAFLVAAGIGATLVQVYVIFVEYYSYPVSISVNMTFSQTLLFPAVSICNVNQIRKSKLHLAEDKLQSALPHTLESGNTSSLFTGEGRAQIRSDVNNVWANLDNTTKKEMGHQKEDLIIDCYFNGDTCSAHDFDHFYNPFYGNCYTFNSGWRGRELQYSHLTGPFYGLTLELFIEQDEYIPELTEVAGVFITIHDHHIMPFPEDEGILASAGHMTMLGIRMIQIYRQKAPYPSNCRNLSNERSEKYNAYSEHLPVSYSFTACQKTCYQAHVMGECSCHDPTIPADGAAVRKLMTNQDKVVYSCATAPEEECKSQVRKQYLNGTLECDCGISCEEVIFVPSVSQGIWPNDEFAEVYYNSALEKRSPHLEEIIQEWRNESTSPALNLAKVQIYFEDLNFEQVKEIPSLTLSSMLSGLGGIVGLFLGISIVSFFQFLELLADLMILFGQRIMKKQNKIKSIDIKPAPDN